MSEANPPEQVTSEKQCRICLDEEDQELGRLIRPCLCKGSISYVHVKCLQRWRNTAPSRAAFYSCSQCGYHYRFARTRVAGIATNPVIVGAISAILFTILVICCSYITTYLLYDLDVYDTYVYSVTPWGFFRDLVQATTRTLTDPDLEERVMKLMQKTSASHPPRPPGLLRKFVRRFLLGLPVVGGGATIHMLSALPFRFYWLRWRSRQGGSMRNASVIILIIMVLVGAARALYKVYELTEYAAKRLLLRAEDAILEVN